MATALANLLLSGVRVHQDPYVLEKGVLDALGPNSYLVSVKVLPSRQSVSEHIPNHGGGPGWDADKLTWLIRAYGTVRGLPPPGGGPVPVGRGAAHYLIDDATGKTIGYGAP